MTYVQPMSFFLKKNVCNTSSTMHRPPKNLQAAALQFLASLLIIFTDQSVMEKPGGQCSFPLLTQFLHGLLINKFQFL